MSQNIVQFQEPIPVKTPLGDGYAIIFEGGAHDHYWTVALNDGALVTFRQEQIRAANSYTHGRGISDKRMRKIVQK